jgi:hypothetical protein
VPRSRRGVPDDADNGADMAQLGNRLAPEFESWDDLEETKLPDLKIILEGIRCSGWLGGGELALKPTGSSISGKF